MGVKKATETHQELSCKRCPLAKRKSWTAPMGPYFGMMETVISSIRGVLVKKEVGWSSIRWKEKKLSLNVKREGVRRRMFGGLRPAVARSWGVWTNVAQTRQWLWGHTERESAQVRWGTEFWISFPQTKNLIGNVMWMKTEYVEEFQKK